MKHSLKTENMALPHNTLWYLRPPTMDARSRNDDDDEQRPTTDDDNDRRRPTTTDDEQAAKRMRRVVDAARGRTDAGDVDVVVSVEAVADCVVGCVAVCCGGFSEEIAP